MLPTLAFTSTSSPVSSLTSRRALSIMFSPELGVPLGKAQTPRLKLAQSNTSIPSSTFRRTTPPAEVARSTGSFGNFTILLTWIVKEVRRKTLVQPGPLRQLLVWQDHAVPDTRAKRF